MYTYRTIDIITKRNNNAPPMDNPNIKGQSTSSSPTLVLDGTENDMPDSMSLYCFPLMASCIALAGTDEFVAGLITTNETAPVVGSIWTRTSSLVKVLIRKKNTCYELMIEHFVRPLAIFLNCEAHRGPFRKYGTLLRLQ